MKCVICRNGETADGKTTVTIEQDDTLLVMRGVPARVCQNCGEAYIEGETTDVILRAAEDAQRQHVQFDVRQYDAA